MVWHGFLAKAVPTVVTGAVGVAAYEALRKMVVKVRCGRQPCPLPPGAYA